MTRSAAMAEFASWEHQARDAHGRWAKGDRPWDPEHAKIGEAVHDSLVRSRPKLSGQQAQRVRHYSGDGFSEMNRRLRDGTQDMADRHGTDALDRIVRGSVAQHDMVLLHGRAQLGRVKPGDRVHEPGFLSTTTDGATAKTYAGVGKGAAVVRVRLKKGESALSTRGLSSNPSEKEVLLPKDQDYRVLKVQQATGQYGQPIRLVDVEIDHGGGSGATGGTGATALSMELKLHNGLPGGIMPPETISAQARTGG